MHKKVYDNVLDLIGNTPIVKLNKVRTSDMAEIWAKIEYCNPAGSVKDRICLSMIEDAERKGLLKPGSVIIEPSSGNTGIGIAMIAAVKGYRCIIVMPESMSLERIYILKSYGAEVVLTPAAKGMLGSIKKAQAIHDKIPKSFMPQQFKNNANPRIHKTQTAKEILDVVDRRIDAFVVCVGTGGTITGVGEVLKKRYPDIKIVAVEPSGSPVLAGGTPGAHMIQGIGAGFIPDVLNEKIIDEIIHITDKDAFLTAKLLAEKEGLFVGISSGAAMWAALKVAAKIGKGKLVLTVFPDTGERYFTMERYFET